MSVFDPPDLLLSDPGRVTSLLIEALKGGFLSVFVGAGISMSAKLDPSGPPVFPSWGGLVEECCGRSGVPFDKSKEKENDYLLRTAERVETACESKSLDFVEVVEKALYKNCASYDKKLLKLDLLIALGSLVMTSTRGSASVVVNYNFDDLLEWYLLLHGFTVTVVSNLPTLTPKADVVIYHPHGFLPKVKKFSPLRSSAESLIFTKRSYQRAHSESPWNEFQRFRCGCNICLFVGMSGDDAHVEWLLSSVHDRLNGQRIVGVILLKDNKDNRDREEENKKRGLISYYLANHDDLPDYLLTLCQAAGGS